MEGARIPRGALGLLLTLLQDGCWQSSGSFFLWKFPCVSGVSQCTGRDQAESDRVFIQVHYGLGKPAPALPPKSLTPSFPSIADGPFPAVPGSQDTDVLGHFGLFSRVAYPTLTLRVLLHRGEAHQGAEDFTYLQVHLTGHTEGLQWPVIQESVWVEVQWVSLWDHIQRHFCPLLFGFVDDGWRLCLGSCFP